MKYLSIFTKMRTNCKTTKTVLRSIRPPRGMYNIFKLPNFGEELLGKNLVFVKGLMKGVREGEGTSNGDTNSSLSISGTGPTGRHLFIGVSMDGVILCHSIVLLTVSKGTRTRREGKSRRPGAVLTDFYGTSYGFAIVLSWNDIRATQK